MTTLEYGQRIDEALKTENPQASVERIKRAVIDEFEALDSKILIKSTEYFNHSFVPDLVATWEQSGETGERYIYIRFNSNVSNIIEDVSAVQDSQPIIFGLGRTPLDQGFLTRKLDEASINKDTLVTDGFGVQKLIGRDRSKFMDVAVSSLVQGGRGLVDETAAAGAVETIDQGFSGALDTNRKLTSRAAERIEKTFSKRSSSRMIGLLQAAWAGGGGRIEDFPGRRELMAKVTDDALQFLLDYDPIGDAEFWRIVGSDVTVGQLSRLDVPTGSSNLDKFMKSNIDRLWSKVCRVTNRRLDEVEASERRWFIGPSNIGFRGKDFEVHMAEKSDSLSETPAEESEGVPLRELLGRTAGVPITEAELASHGRVIRYSSSDHADISNDAMLINLADEFQVDVFVKKVSVHSRGGKNISCDLTKSTSAGHARSQIPISDLVLSTVPLVRSMNQQDMEDLRGVVTPLFRDPEQLEIFHVYESGNELGQGQE